MQKRVLFRIFLTNYIDFLCFSIVVPVLPFVFSTGETGIFGDLYTDGELKFWYGCLIGIFSVGALFGAPLLGTISDRIGRKKVLIFANFVNVLGYWGMAMGVHTISLMLMFFARFMGGLLGATLNTVQAALADVSDERSKARNFGITGVAFGLGFVSGLLIFGILSQFEWFSFTLAFGIAGALNILNMLYLWWFFPETLPVKSEQPIYIWSGVTNVFRAFRSEKFGLIFVIIFMLTIGFAFFVQYLQFYLIERFAFDEMDVATIFIFMGIVVAVTQGIFLKPISQRFSTNQVLLFCLPIFTLTYLLILLPQSKFTLYLIFPIMIFFQGIIFPTALAVVSNLADKDIQGEIIGINQSVQSLSNALPPILLGFAVGLSLTFPMYFGAVSTFIAWLLFLRFYRKQS